MEVRLALLADAANRTDNGKLNLLGVFQSLYAQTVPCTHPQMFLVITLRADPSERGRTIPVRVALVDPDGKALTQLPEMPVAVPSDVNQPVFEQSLIVGLMNVGFPGYGGYEFVIEAAGKRLGAVPIEVQRVPVSV